MLGPGEAGQLRPHTMLTARIAFAPRLTGMVRVAGSADGCQSVAGLPSTAARAGAPGAALDARGSPQRTASLVLSRSGRRVASTSACPRRTRCVDVGVTTYIGAPLAS